MVPKVALLDGQESHDRDTCLGLIRLYETAYYDFGNLKVACDLVNLDSINGKVDIVLTFTSDAERLVFVELDDDLTHLHVSVDRLKLLTDLFYVCRLSTLGFCQEGRFHNFVGQRIHHA